MSENVMVVYKPVSVTPLQCIDRIRKLYPRLQSTKIAYAGRLDPMAEGVLLLLLGEECKKRKEYESLEKTYEFEVLFGVSTDTNDVMGMPTSPVIRSYIKETYIRNLLPQLIGSHPQPYPAYSSARVQGKPLYWWAMRNRLNEIEIPKKQVDVTSLTLNNRRTLTQRTILNIFEQKISPVIGNFRQTEILHAWHSLLTLNPSLSLPVYSFTAAVSSGTYIRSLAHTIGTLLDTHSLAFSIKRTAVGPYKISSAIQV